VIELGSASSRVENSTSVSLEDGGIGLNGNGYWSGSDGSLKLSNGVCWDVCVASNEDLSFGGILMAGSLHGSVCVGTFKFNCGSFGVLESVGLPSSVTSVRSGIAINDFLLGEADEFTSGEEMSSFHGANGRESPA
jgi:hypothetical protein